MPDQPSNFPPVFDGEVRLFPLSNLVMFPNNLLPLHIFESRYREMLEDAVHDDQLITMATLIPGFEHDYHGRPPIAPVVCIGRVTAHEKTEQGTYNLMLLGLQRARIEHEIEPVRSFRRARVQVISDGLSETDAMGRKLGKRLADRILQILPSAQEVVEAFIQRKIPLAALTDVVAFYMPLPIELKLQLLAEADVFIRTELLLASLPATKARRHGTRRYPGDFSTN